MDFSIFVTCVFSPRFEVGKVRIGFCFVGLSGKFFVFTDTVPFFSSPEAEDLSPTSVSGAFLTYLKDMVYPLSLALAVPGVCFPSPSKIDTSSSSSWGKRAEDVSAMISGVYTVIARFSASKESSSFSRFTASYLSASDLSTESSYRCPCFFQECFGFVPVVLFVPPRLDVFRVWHGFCRPSFALCMGVDYVVPL